MSTSAPPSVNSAPAPAAGWAWPANARVLVVDDNLINQTVAAKLLQRQGLQAGTGGNGCCWYFLYSPPAFSSRTAATGGFTAYPAVFTFYLHICLLFLRTNAGNGFPALLPANRARA